ncbi:2OG-Fe(II) oxygenase [Streptomyces eurythermus]|uniref:2OG-Fe(II) oxygenase n=1 Tax=Streptomyces flaveolus TaxID=67297 RepID=A0ABV3ADQ3_9ACTN
MTPTRELTVSGRRLYLFDDVLAPHRIKELGARFEQASYRRDEADGPETAHARTFNVDVPDGELDTDVADLATTRVTTLFPDRELQLYRAHCNLVVYGDMGYPHRDCAPDRDDVTALLFVNATWRREWGGEITFYDDDADAVLAVTPRPGRLLVFEGAIDHRVGIPLRDCYEPRLTLAVKFKTPGEWR